MNNQEEILRKQNDEGMLKCQYAARKYYNRAEIMNYLSWVLALICSVLIFIPDRFGVLLLMLPAAIDVLTLILQCLVEKAVKNGAKFRNFYDAKVLGICDSYSSFEEREIWEKANSLVDANKDDYAYQSTHTGKDSPPGLKDWYVFSRKYTTPEDAIFECQKQNYWWTDKLYQKRIHYYIITAIIITVITVIGLHFYPLKTILCLIGLVVKLYTDIQGSIQCSHIMQSIKAFTELPRTAINSSILESLQEKIKKRREIQILEMNQLHSKNASKWSDLYEKTSTDNNSH